jgi:hypothetical protein
MPIIAPCSPYNISFVPSTDRNFALRSPTRSAARKAEADLAKTSIGDRKLLQISNL